MASVSGYLSAIWQNLVIGMFGKFRDALPESFQEPLLLGSGECSHHCCQLSPPSGSTLGVKNHLPWHHTTLRAAHTCWMSRTGVEGPSAFRSKANSSEGQYSCITLAGLVQDTLVCIGSITPDVQPCFLCSLSYLSFQSPSPHLLCKLNVDREGN